MTLLLEAPRNQRTPAVTRRDRRSWLLVAGPVLLAALLRGYQLARPGYLLGVTEYDDGVYLGETLRWLAGAVPYRDFPAVHPPAIFYLLAPVGLLHHVLGTDGVMAAGRILTAAVDVANVALVGRLLWPRGRAASVAGMTFLAIYPSGIEGAHTILLEPWLDLFCLLGALAIFGGAGTVGGRLSGRRTAMAGLFFGVAGCVKIFAVLPAVVVVAVLAVRHRRLIAHFVLAAVAGFAALAAPFFLAAPGSFVHDVVVDQLTRSTAMRTPGWLRLTYLDGVNFFFAVPPGTFKPASGLPVLALVVVGGGFFTVLVLLARTCVPARRRTIGDLDLFVLGSCVVVIGSLWWAASFWYHYASFAGPFFALVIGLSVPGVLRRLRRPGAARRLLVVAVGTVVLVELAAIGRSHGDPAPNALGQVLPTGSCVFADEASLTITSDTFASEAPPRCPPMADSDGATLAWDGGIETEDLVLTPAAEPVVARWEAVFSRADYLVLSGGVAGSIPMTPQMKGFLASHFTVRLILTHPDLTVYRNRRPLSRPGPP